MPIENPGTLDFGHGLNLERAEAAVASLALLTSEMQETVLDLRKIRHIDVGASWRLGNALRQASRISRVKVLLPPGYDLSASEWYKWLTHSGLGLSFAQYAYSVHSGNDDVTSDLRRYYGESRSSKPLRVPAWHSATFLLVPNLHSGTLPSDNPAQFTEILRALLTDTQFDLEAYSRRELESLYRFLFEAVQNVFDHSDKFPHQPGQPILSHLAIRFYRTISPPKAMTREFSDYLRCVSSGTHPTSDPVGFVEMVVLDDGVGIAARQSQDPDIYKGEFAPERQAVSKAFETGGSVKISLSDTTTRGAPGYGFAKIADALQSLQAFAVVRTGRSLTYYDGTRRNKEFLTLPDPLGSMPGTVLQIVLPRRRAHLWSRLNAD